MASQDRFWDFDFIPHFGAAVGNVRTYASLGPLLRIGINIPDEFATQVVPGVSPKYGIYFFSGVEGWFVARNIFLDGNTFTHSHRVDKIPWVGSLRVGVTAVLKQVELTAGFTWLTQEFETQRGNDSYGTASVTFKF